MTSSGEWRSAAVAFGKKAWIGSDRRVDRRVRLTMPAKVAWSGRESQLIIVREVSAWGFRAALPTDLGLRSMFRLELPTGETVHAQVVRIDRDTSACEFLMKLESDVLESLSGHESTIAAAHLSLASTLPPIV